MMFKAQKAYYCEYNYHINKDGKEIYYCMVIADENEAKKLDKNYRLATIDELEEEIGLGMEMIPVAEVQDGIYGYFECTYIDDLGYEEYFCKYIKMENN